MEHQDEAQRIAIRSTCLMHGLFVSDRARQDDMLIRQRMREHYHGLFAQEMFDYCSERK